MSAELEHWRLVIPKSGGPDKISAFVRKPALGANVRDEWKSNLSDLSSRAFPSTFNMGLAPNCGVMRFDRSVECD